MIHFARNWRAVGLRGVVAILCGVAAFIWPGLTLEVPAGRFPRGVRWIGHSAARASGPPRA